MTITRKFIAVSCTALTVALAGCWDDDDEVAVVPPPVVITEVPASAGVRAASFITFLLSLSGSDESSEPLTISTAFAVPAEDSAEPTVLP